jgi:hypothetical protein
MGGKKRGRQLTTSLSGWPAFNPIDAGGGVGVAGLLQHMPSVWGGGGRQVAGWVAGCGHSLLEGRSSSYEVSSQLTEG